MSTNQASGKATQQQVASGTSCAIDGAYYFLSDCQEQAASWQMSAAAYLRKLEERNFYENLGARPIGIALVSSHEQPIF